jgi:hypothetical protein
MNVWKPGRSIAAAIGVTLLLLHIAGASSRAMAAEGSVGLAATESIASAHLAEPLVATSATTLEEDFKLSRAVSAYEQRTKPDDVSSLAAKIHDVTRF